MFKKWVFILLIVLPLSSYGDNSKGNGYPIPPMPIKNYTTPGSYTYTINNCSQMKIKVWGGGAAGSWSNTGSDSTADKSGGAGGYIEDVVNIQTGAQGATFKINVGEGATFMGQDGGASSVTYNESLNWTANGGQNGKNHGGVSYGGTATSSFGTTARACKGGEGDNSHYIDVNGGKAYRNASCTKTISQSANDCPYAGGMGGIYRAPFGAGGCSGDDAGEGHPGSWGMGGNGRVILQCLYRTNLQ